MQSQQFKAIKTSKYTFNSIKRGSYKLQVKKKQNKSKSPSINPRNNIYYSQAIDLSKNTRKEVERSMIKLD